jgi:hypothetical protein
MSHYGCEQSCPIRIDHASTRSFPRKRESRAACRESVVPGGARLRGDERLIRHDKKIRTVKTADRAKSQARLACTHRRCSGGRSQRPRVRAPAQTSRPPRTILRCASPASLRGMFSTSSKHRQPWRPLPANRECSSILSDSRTKRKRGPAAERATPGDSDGNAAAPRSLFTSSGKVWSELWPPVHIGKAT